MNDSEQTRPTDASSIPRGVTADELISDLKEGDSIAATRLHQLCAPRLIAFVRQRINPDLARRLDAEDVVQSAFRSFFRVVGADDWDSGGKAQRVWSLLYAITLNKLKVNCRYHTAAKRSVGKEVYDTETLALDDTQQPELIFAEELEWVLQRNTTKHQRILELLLSGHTEAEVAELQNCSVRTVYRVLERVTNQLQTRLSD